MRRLWRDAWSCALFTLAAFGLLFVALLFAGPVFNDGSSPWHLLLLLGMVTLAAGVRHAWRGRALGGAIVGIVLAMGSLITAMFVLPEPVAAVTSTDFVWTVVYTIGTAAIVTTAGFALGRHLRSWHHGSTAETERGRTDE